MSSLLVRSAGPRAGPGPSWRRQRRPKWASGGRPGGQPPRRHRDLSVRSVAGLPEPRAARTVRPPCKSLVFESRPSARLLLLYVVAQQSARRVWLRRAGLRAGRNPGAKAPILSAEACAVSPSSSPSRLARPYRMAASLGTTARDRLAQRTQGAAAFPTWNVTSCQGHDPRTAVSTGWSRMPLPASYER